ncbi:hypothetical protein [Streptomyces rapamycinicus]|uniref:Integral membrane protein n=1 Tax=Streptomyces rapamycinicus TaxID=1226757 RepID=A0ABR6LUN4_9ACTN|nr:hypothetical protein [Streptomyces rapamycinicus]AGP58357.1 hypothetical protein M271_34730 [Streptomyces rapamycinicus NRRL 5491]MBB4786051.1 hypothetical protein [Streptomyces rapamycinicus]UTO66173.1 hypothetical protein LJB45_30190 [Streptomyces rapamycinicus]UTP34127.1 hypothetical protein LIV37_35325 [Streptomyces rapamycinicus NRRL 5491]
MNRIRALGSGFVAVVIAVLFGWLLASGARAAPDAPAPEPSGTASAAPGSPAPSSPSWGSSPGIPHVPTAPPSTTEKHPCASPSSGSPPSDCIPQPSSSGDASSVPLPTEEPDGDDDDGGGPGGVVGWIVDGINAAITVFFKGLVTKALNPLLDLLGKTLLSTPTLDQLPRIGELWSNSWHIMLACYGMLIMIAGIVVMAYQSVQTHYSIKEIAPRIVLGFLAAALSLFVANKAIATTNALSRAVLSEGVDEDSAAKTLRNLILNSINGGIFVIFMQVFIAGMLVALLVTYAVRVALTMIMVAGAPLALMCHALPQTDGIARWWWRSFFGLLAVQLAQSLTLVIALRVFLDPDGFTLLGPNKTGLVDLIVSLALMYILFKIPFWILGSLRGSHRRSFTGSLVRTYIAAKTLGALRGMNSTSAFGAASRSRTGRNSTPIPAQTRRSTRAASPPVVRRRPPGPALFREPVPGATPPFGPQIGPPGMPTFRAPTSPSNNNSASPRPAPMPRPTTPPGPPSFRTPGSGTPPPTRTGYPTTPSGRPRFQPPTDPSPTRPRRTRDQSAPVTFRPPVPAPTAPVPRKRTSAPPPPRFSSPPPHHQPSPRQGRRRN